MTICNFRPVKLEQRTGRRNGRFSFLCLSPADAALAPCLQFLRRRRELFATRFLLTMTLPPSSLSVSIPLSHCLFASLSFAPFSLGLSPLAYSRFFFHGALPPTVAHPPQTRSNGLSSVPRPSFPSLLPSLSYRVHRILTALSGTTATRKLL